MAKKTEKIPGPDPLPKIGDTVNYVWPPELEPRSKGGEIVSAQITAVYTSLDSRVVDLSADPGTGPVALKSVPWQDPEVESGNTWHWPA